MEMEHVPLFCIALSEVTTGIAGIHQQLHGGYQLSGEDFQQRIVTCSRQIPPRNGAYGYFPIMLSRFFLTRGSEGSAGTFRVIPRISTESIPLWLG